jgi:hypothetical protein
VDAKVLTADALKYLHCKTVSLCGDAYGIGEVALGFLISAADFTALRFGKRFLFRTATQKTKVWMPYGTPADQSKKP